MLTVLYFEDRYMFISNLKIYNQMTKVGKSILSTCFPQQGNIGLKLNFSFWNDHRLTEIKRDYTFITILLWCQGNEAIEAKFQILQGKSQPCSYNYTILNPRYNI